MMGFIVSEDKKAAIVTVFVHPQDAGDADLIAAIEILSYFSQTRFFFGIMTT